MEIIAQTLKEKKYSLHLQNYQIQLLQGGMVSTLTRYGEENNWMRSHLRPLVHRYGTLGMLNLQGSG